MANETNAQALDQQDEQEQQEGQQATQGVAQQSQGNTNDQQKTFTQEQVNRMMTREKRQGRAAAFRELGIDPKDNDLISAIKATISSHKQASGNDDAVAQLEHRTLVAEAKAEAMQQGAQPSFVDDIVTLALSKMEDGADVQTVVGEVKTKYPVWFQKVEDDQADGKKAKSDDNKGQESQDKPAANRRGTGSSIANRNAVANGEQNLGSRLASQRKSHNSSKKSFWG